MTRGDIYLLDFGIPFGSEPGMCRPVVIIQSDKEILNGLNTKVVIPLTSNTINSTLRGNVFISKKKIQDFQKIQLHWYIRLLSLVKQD